MPEPASPSRAELGERALLWTPAECSSRLAEAERGSPWEMAEALGRPWLRMAAARPGQFLWRAAGGGRSPWEMAEALGRPWLRMAAARPEQFWRPEVSALVAAPAPQP